ncbi:hypothetical protein FBY35_6063 [Streptomyces sp. SLBN-118]|uniref:hypothetical protein n=1 Tax=Streptomyces sp. SLBN-118 TaxID=2768454 RepID=UPI001153371F|nr:hypothetical protein [Streptomyces sp. SLBN-118]TQK44554.1 hypothetical protein FBY35_6063 [Streptomyces sp. SLBN-118]
MNPHRKSRSSPAPGPGLSRQVQGGLTAAALVLIPLLAVGGSDDFRAALDFTTGVLSLVSLTASVAWGLIATDRLLLSTRHRLLAQGIHRGTAVASLGFLLLHATVKVSLGHVELIGALVPFGLGVTGTSSLIGFGSLAGFLMVIAATTGALRSALAANVKVAGRWRPLHMLAYPAWCFALVHGLYTGRPAATWVVTMYCLTLTAVAAAVAVRMLPRPTKRRLAAKILSIVGSADDRQGAEERALRDLNASPLPGASGVTAPAGLNGMNGIPSQRPYEAEFQREVPLDPFGSRAQPRRLAAPSPQLYEAPPPPIAEAPAERTAGGGMGPGTGISAAYRAVSLAADQAAPLAERIPMTEEIPVITESGPRPGMWPAPSPPPPAQAFAEPSEPPAPSAYEPPPVYEAPTSPSYGTAPYDTALYDTPSPYEPSAYQEPPSPYQSGTAGGYEDTAPMPGPLFPPPAGEPWNAPAGD